ncbi:uncharacterized protein SPPG_02189 [Spizellomyces punctatus DAOM BR117]|uniref:Fas-binding factor 1 C-terminal domain-containing protein n=1 Tax=Spizellomyces punctatus (strain DAOM BR117) TaxID=645134 RepID=A0A0L0HQ20_SPIPD|nr:uncharacterized protein SPPG_02189 [Spizellomyces punctatus DAOM BR117]KND03128.1 hypothetical protein SPPG_02189 [Spizellomyces punctatus DAOM BR117]|eukprot:XP_016611167.1 hypothetical protein SPPG_02189 [Spizellomyces punctatus DAOM BR117]
MSWPPPPIGKQSSEGENKKKSGLDFDFDDEDLDDLLLSSDNEERKRKPNSVTAKKDNKEHGAFKSGETAPAATSSFPAAKTSLPSASTSSPRPSSSASSGNHARPSFSIPQPVSLATNKPLASTDANNVDDILKGLEDMDDLDADLFKISKQPAGNAIKESTGVTINPRTNSPIPKEAPDLTTAFKRTEPLTAPSSQNESGVGFPPSQKVLSTGLAGDSMGFAGRPRQRAEEKPQNDEQADLSKNAVNTGAARKPLLPWEKRAAASSASTTVADTGRSATPVIKTVPAAMVDTGRNATPVVKTVPAMADTGRNATPVTKTVPAAMPDPVRPVSATQQGTTSKPKAAASDDDEFVPAFLLEASGPRRAGRPRREEPPTPIIAETAPEPRRINLPFLDAKPSIVKQEPNPAVPRAAVPAHLPPATPSSAALNPAKQHDVDTSIPSSPKKTIPVTTKEPRLTQSSTSTESKPLSQQPAPKSAPSINQHKLVRTDTSLSSIADLSAIDDKANDEEEEEESSPLESVEESEVQDVELSETDATTSEPILARKPMARTASTTLVDRDRTKSRGKEGGRSSLGQEEVSQLRQQLAEAETRLKEVERERQSVEEDLKTKLQSTQNELQDKTLQLKEIQTKFCEERATLYDQCSAEKKKIEEENAALVSSIKEAHAVEIDRIKAVLKEDMDRRVVLELQKAAVEHDRALADIKQEHLKEMSKVISNAEGARQLEMLAEKIADSSRFVDSMQQRLESDHSYSVKEREASFQARERQINEMQKHLIDQQRELDEERVKIQDLVKTMENNMWEAKKHQEEERRRIVEERARLEAHMAELKADKDETLAQLHTERVEFLKSKEEWALERRRITQQIAEERKVLAMERATIESQKHAVVELEREVEQLRAREETQLHADRLILDRETHNLHSRLTDIHKEAAALRAERLRLDALRAQLDAERSLFEAGRDATERAVREAVGMRDVAVKERQQAHQFHSEAEEAKLALEAKKTELEAERKRLEQERKRFLEERVALADERRKSQIRTMLGKSDQEQLQVPPSKWTTSPTNPLPSAHETTNNMRTDSAPTSSTVKPSYNMSSQPPNLPTNINLTSARQLFSKLNRFVGGLRDSEAILDDQLHYLVTSNDRRGRTWTGSRLQGTNDGDSVFLRRDGVQVV